MSTRRSPVTQGIQRGFTLLELLIAIALLLVIMLLIAQMFGSAQSLYRIAADRSDTYSQGRIALDVIEADLQRINYYGDLTAVSRSPSMKNPEDVIKQEEYEKHWDTSEFTDLPTNDRIGDMKIFLSMFTTTSWYDPELQKYEEGLAQVNYYLKKRPTMMLAGTEVEPSTAYIIRRIIPVRYDMPTSRPGAGSSQRSSRKIFEEEVCNSVLDVRVWVTNNGAAAYMAQRKERMEFMSLLVPQSQSTERTTVAQSLVDRSRSATGGAGGQNSQQPANTSVATFYGGKNDDTSSFGPTAGGNSEYVATRGSFPLSVIVEVTFANDKFYASDDGEEWQGTFRTLSRSVSIPAVTIGANLSDTDLEKLR